MPINKDKTTPITVNIPKEDLAMINEIVKELSVNRSVWIKMTLKEKINEYKKKKEKEKE